MTRSELLKTTFAQESAKDPGAFDRWLRTNVAIASIFAAAVLGMALGSSNAPGPAQAIAGEAIAGDATAAEIGTPAPDRVLSSYELTVRIAPDQLPLEQVEQPF